MDQMHFEEEIQDKEYFELKIQKFEERIRILEDKALLCGHWPENVTDLEERAENIRKGRIGEVIQRFVRRWQQSLDDAIGSGAGGSGNIIIEEDSDGE